MVLDRSVIERLTKKSTSILLNLEDDKNKYDISKKANVGQRETNDALSILQARGLIDLEKKGREYKIKLSPKVRVIQKQLMELYDEFDG